MIETKPKPTIRTLAYLLGALTPPSDAKLAAQWSLEGDTAFCLSRSSWGMAALANAFKARTGRPARVWLPEYFCDQALWPLRRQQVELSFYPIDDRAWPDWAGIHADSPPDLFYITHFYGHAGDNARARAFCDAEGALLVEDATHALGPDQTIGRSGDFVFYSPWKFFETPNGAVMLIRPRAADWIAPVAKALAEFGSRISPGLGWMKEIALSKLPGVKKRAVFASCGEGDFFKDPPILPISQRPKPSPVTRPLLLSVKLVETGQRRRTNDAAIRAFFADRSGWQVFDPTPAHGPLRSAFRVDSPERAAAAHTALRLAGIQAEGWPGLPGEIQSTAKAVRLRRTVINLPCHQGLSPRTLFEVLERSGVAKV